jgi:hypothetical protein
MTIENVSLTVLKTELARLAEDSRRLKRWLRTTWTRPMADVQQELVRVRRRTTELCILRAWLRGKMHLQKPLREGAYPGMEWDRARYHELVMKVAS